MPQRRRTLAAALFVYGAVGVALVVVGIVVGMGLAARIERLAVSADDALAAAARTTRATADAFTSVDDNLDQAGASTRTAAALARDAAGTLSSLAIAMEISIFGAQPLVGLAADFNDSAEQATELADALDGVGASLVDTRTDVAVIGVEMERLADDLERVREQGGGDGAPPIRAFIGLLLAWLAMPAIGAVLVGFLIWPRSVRLAEDAPQPEQGDDVEDDADPAKGP